MSYRLVYHWWSHESDPFEHAKNLRSPLILSIATARAQNQDIPITVLDGSTDKNPERWEKYPTKLNFEVRPTNFLLSENYSSKPGYKHLSRLFDLKQFSDEVVIYSDADVFWFKNIIPLYSPTLKFAFDGWNSGFFYFAPSQKQVKKFFEIFKSYTLASLNSEDVRSIMKKYVGYDDWYYVFDEMILSYMFNTQRHIFTQISTREHCTARQLSKVSPEDIKMFHANGSMFHNHLAKHVGESKHCRGLIPLIWKELWKSIQTVLDQEDIESIFTEQELKHYIPKQYDFLSKDGFDRLSRTRENNTFFLHNSLNSSNIQML